MEATRHPKSMKMGAFGALGRFIFSFSWFWGMLIFDRFLLNCCRRAIPPHPMDFRPLEGTAIESEKAAEASDSSVEESHDQMPRIMKNIKNEVVMVPECFKILWKWDLECSGRPSGRQMAPGLRQRSIPLADVVTFFWKCVILGAILDPSGFWRGSQNQVFRHHVGKN